MPIDTWLFPLHPPLLTNYGTMLVYSDSDHFHHSFSLCSSGCITYIHQFSYNYCFLLSGQKLLLRSSNEFSISVIALVNSIVSIWLCFVKSILFWIVLEMRHYHHTFLTPLRLVPFGTLKCICSSSFGVFAY